MDRRDLALLLESADDLGDTFARNRLMKQRENEFNLTRADRTRESDLDRAMREKEFGLRRDDAADLRAVRREGLAETGRHHAAIEDYQARLAGAKDEAAKWDILREMGKAGMLTEEGLDVMSKGMNEKFGELGVGVKLFKLPAAEGGTPQFHTDPETGERFATHGKSLMRSPRPMADVTEEEDPITHEMKRKVSRKVPVSELDAEMQRLKLRSTDDLNARGEATPDQEREMQDILAGPALPAQGPPPGRVAQPPDPTRVERVAVISPQGKRGTIPRSQLQDALKRGFKQVQ
jgi:hypothetical protein